MAITAQRFIEAREQSGLSILEMASVMKLQTAQIYALENGSRGAGAALLKRYIDAGILTYDECARALLGNRSSEAA